jgi:hypothetical protein
MRTTYHAIGSLAMVLLLYFLRLLQTPLGYSIIFGVIIGVVLDIDHLVWAFCYNRKKVVILILDKRYMELVNVIRNNIWNNFGDSFSEKLKVYIILHTFSAFCVNIFIYLYIRSFLLTSTCVMILHLVFDVYYNINKYA